MLLLVLMVLIPSAYAGFSYGVHEVKAVHAGKKTARRLSSQEVKIEAGRVIVDSSNGRKSELFSGGTPGEEKGICQVKLGNSSTEGSSCNIACAPDSRMDSINSEQFVQVQSHVNIFARQYQDENIDLSVKAPGGYIKVYRVYTNDKWQFEHEYNSLGVSTVQAGNIHKSGMIYRRGKDGLFHYKSFIIRQLGERYRWENKRGEYVLFSKKGKMLETGNLFGALARYRYKDDQLISIDDRTSTPVYNFIYDENGKVTRISDQHGREVSYVWQDDKLNKVVDVLSNTMRYSYNIDGRLVEKADDAGRKFYVSYHPDGAVRNVLSRKGGGHSFSYKQEEGGSVFYAKVTSTMGNVQEYWFNAVGETLKIKENENVVREDTWDEGTRMSVDELGYRTTRTYDKQNNLTKVAYEDGSSVRFSYDTNNNLIRVIDELDVETHYSYNKKGLVDRIWAAFGTDEQVLTEYEYDKGGNRIRSTVESEAGSVTTRFTYDELDNLITITDPLGGVYEYEYDYMGNVVKETDASGLSGIMVYDLKGRLRRIRYHDGQSLESVYDAADRLISQTDGEGHSTLYSYDYQDNLTKVKDSMGGVIRYSYDNGNRLTKKIDEEGKYHVFFYVGGSDRVSKIVDGNGNEVNITYRAFDNCGSCPMTFSHKPVRIQFPTFTRQFKYDRRGRLEEKSDLYGTLFLTERYSYDKAGRLITRIDKDGSSTHWDYDNLNRVITITDRASGATHLRYDRLGNLIALTDAGGNTTRYEYDLLGRKTVEKRPQGGVFRYGYDPAGRLLYRRDGKGQEIRYSYDANTGYLMGYNFSQKKTKARGQAVKFSYDNKGRLTGYEDGVTKATYGYDSLGRRTSVLVDYGSFASRHSYTYYKNGLKKTYIAPDGLVHSYRYTPINTLEEVSIYGVGSIGFDSYKWLRPERVVSPGMVRRDHVDDFLRLAARKTMVGGKIILDQGYRYNAVDNIVRRSSGHGVTDYSYDRLQRLIAVEHEGKLPEVFRYDAIGNIVSTSSESKFEYDSGYQLIAMGDTTYKYDIDGNALEKKNKDGVLRFVYNFENRVVGVIKDGVESRYYYDPFGRRLYKDVAGKRTWFAYSDEGLVAEFDKDGEMLTSYSWQPDGPWSTDPILLSQGNKHYFYHNDNLGTPQTLTDTEGKVVWLANYNSFGAISIEKEEVGNNLRLPGQYYDEETGLHYNWHRYYEPETGRYLSPDPMGLEGGMNLFSYVDGNPVNWVDPWGLSPRPAGVLNTQGLHWRGPATSHYNTHVTDGCLGAACQGEKVGFARPEIAHKDAMDEHQTARICIEQERGWLIEKSDFQSWLLDFKANGRYGHQCKDEYGALEKDYDRLMGGWVASSRSLRELTDYKRKLVQR